MSARPRSGPTTTPAIHALLDFFFGEGFSGISVGLGSLPAPPVALAVADRVCVGARRGQPTVSKDLLS